MLLRFFLRDPVSPAPEQERFSRFFSHFRADEVARPPATPEAIARGEEQMETLLPLSVRQLLSIQNGGTYNGGLLHVLGISRPERPFDLATWNAPEVWKHSFANPGVQNCIFFSQDAFGNQFGFFPGVLEPPVCRLAINSGQLSHVAGSVTEFFDRLLVDEGLTLLGGDLLATYRLSGSPWKPGLHLGPVATSIAAQVPAVLRPVDPLSNMRTAGEATSPCTPL